MRPTLLATASPLARAAIFGLGCAVLVLFSGSWRIPAPLPRGVDYVPQIIYGRGVASGTIDLAWFGWADPEAPTVDALDVAPLQIRADDIGYPIFRQVWLLMGGDDARETVAQLHNVFVLTCALALGAAALLMTGSLLAGWVALGLALVLRHALRGMLFGALDNRTFVIFFPLALSLLLVLVPPVVRRISRPAGMLGALAIGAVVEAADLVRHSEGLLAFAAVVVACLLAKARLGRRLAAIALMLCASGLVTYTVTGSVRLFNDVRTGRYAGSLLPYLRLVPPPEHSAWHSLQIALGRFPNPEGLYYNDRNGFETVERAYPEIVERAGPYEAARAYYVWYVRTHTRDWFHFVARGLLEMFYFVPYATSVGSAPWALGYLPAKAGVVPHLIEDPRDVPYDVQRYRMLRNVGHGLLLNLRWRYLKLTVVEWLVFLASLVCLPAAICVAARAGDTENRRVFLALLCYTALGVAARAPIPAHGQGVVVAYWGTTILALVYLGVAARFTATPPPNGAFLR